MGAHGSVVVALIALKAASSPHSIFTVDVVPEKSGPSESAVDPSHNQAE